MYNPQLINRLVGELAKSYDETKFQQLKVELDIKLRMGCIPHWIHKQVLEDVCKR